MVVANSHHWPGFSGIRRLFILYEPSTRHRGQINLLLHSGDSYSSLFYQHEGFSDEHHPTANEPLGIQFPGLTYNESQLPNWVGHLIIEYCPPPRFNPDSKTQDPAWDADPLLVYNYARGGDEVSGVARQVRKLFLPIVGTKPDWAPWDESNSLFGTCLTILSRIYDT